MACHNTRGWEAGNLSTTYGHRYRKSLSNIVRGFLRPCLTPVTLILKIEKRVTMTEPGGVERGRGKMEQEGMYQRHIDQVTGHLV